MIPVALANPNVIAVLQGITANIIYAIANSGIRGVVKKNRSTYFTKQRDKNTSLDIGPNIRDVMLAISSSAQPNGAELTIKTSPDGDQEVSLKIPPSKKD